MPVALESACFQAAGDNPWSLNPRLKNKAVEAPVDTKRAELMATARTQDTDTRCHNVRRGIGKRLKRKGAKQVRQHLQQKDRREAEHETCD
jgi:hypothetical protein